MTLLPAASKRRDAHNVRTNYVTLINPSFFSLHLRPLFSAWFRVLFSFPFPQPSPFNATESLDETEMSYLTSVCGRFHGEFANPRGAPFPVQTFGAIQQSCSIFSRTVRKKKVGWSGLAPNKNPLFSLPSNFPTIRVTRVRFHPSNAQSRVYPRLGSLYSAGYSNKIAT